MTNSPIDLLPMPALLLDIAFVLLAIALMWYANVLRDLLEVERKPPLDAMVVIAAWVIIAGFVVPHYIASAFIAPGVSANVDLYQWFWLLQTVSLFALLVAAVLVLYPSISYFRWTR